MVSKGLSKNQRNYDQKNKGERNNNRNIVRSNRLVPWNDYTGGGEDSKGQVNLDD